MTIIFKYGNVLFRYYRDLVFDSPIESITPRVKVELTQLFTVRELLYIQDRLSSERDLHKSDIRQSHRNERERLIYPFDEPRDFWLEYSNYLQSVIRDIDMILNRSDKSRLVTVFDDDDKINECINNHQDQYVKLDLTPYEVKQ